MAAIPQELPFEQRLDKRRGNACMYLEEWICRKGTASAEVFRKELVWCT